MTHVLFIYADNASEWNCSQWRALGPSNAINRYGADEGHSARCLYLSDFVQIGHPTIQDVVARFDLIVVQRNLLSKEIWDACDYWRALGKVVVADLDDDYPRLTPQNPAYRFWIGTHAQRFAAASNYTPIEALTEGLGHVDALLAPNRELLADWEGIVPGIYVPNYAQPEFYSDVAPKPPPASGEPVVIGWGGSVSHFDSFAFSGVLEALARIMARRPEVLLRICGNDYRLRRYLAARLPKGRVEFLDAVAPQAWPRRVASFDVGIAPLAGPQAPRSYIYDRRRSHIKALEYILCGVPWVAAEGPVYADLDGKGGVVLGEESPGAWEDALEEILADLPAAKGRSLEARSWGFDNLTLATGWRDYVRVHESLADALGPVSVGSLPGVQFVLPEEGHGQEA